MAAFYDLTVCFRFDRCLRQEPEIEILSDKYQQKSAIFLENHCNNRYINRYKVKIWESERMRYGFFVGIDNYTNDITRLQCACNDATELYGKFCASGFDRTVLIPEREASSSEILQ